LRRELARGELLAQRRVLAALRVRPPGSGLTKAYALPTLLRWRRA
ncbi:MAG: transposase, partial [Myxococcales bacterium]|nr:transposase [Myxococcales bacterium]